MNRRFLSFSFSTSSGLFACELGVTMSSRTTSSPVPQDALRWVATTPEGVVKAVIADSRKVFNLLSGHGFYVPTYSFDSGVFHTPYVLANRLVLDGLSLGEIVFADDYGQEGQKLSEIENLMIFFSLVKHYGQVR